MGSSAKFRITFDAEENDAQLKRTLHDLGLYAAHTLGDGNCLFRALSDQHHGNPSQHQQLRQDICDYIESHPSQYKAFVDDPLLEPDEAFTRHIELMRGNGTYGSHLEISACARMLHRPIKIIQPGMIYVVNDQDESPSSLKAKGTQGKLRRTARSPNSDDEEESDQTDDDSSPLFIIYHSWEHYSSARNLTGPHAGKPKIHLKGHAAEHSQDKGDLDPSIPTEEEELLLRSLPDPSAHPLSSLRALIASSGSWENALETLLNEERNSSSNPTPTSPSPVPPSSASSQSRPASPKRALSASMQATSLETPPLSRRRISPLNDSSSDESSLSELSHNQHSPDTILANVNGGSSSIDSTLSPADNDSEQARKPQDSAPSPMKLRSSSKLPNQSDQRPKVISAREKKELARRKKHEERLKKIGRNGPSHSHDQQEHLDIKQLHI